MIFMSDPALSGASEPPVDPRWKRAAGSFRAWRDGDARAIDELVRLMTPVLWHVVRAYNLDRTQAEDVVQTVWLRLVRSHESIHDADAVSAWLTTTARREAWRIGTALRKTAPTEDTELEAMLPDAASAEDIAAEADHASRLWAAVQRLDERCRRLIRVIAFDDRPDYAKLARDLDMPVGSIGPTRGRCLGKLRALLKGVIDTPGELDDPQVAT